MIDFFEDTELKNVLSNTDKPISFLVGAPFSWDGAIGVPTVSGMLALIRNTIKRRSPGLLDQYDTRIGPEIGPLSYQEAMAFLLGSFDPEVVASVVQEAVLQAWAPGSPDFDFNSTSDGSPGDWQIPRAVDALARLVRSRPEQFAGPILTTNFDPLISIAFRGAGLRSYAVAVAADGSVTRTIKHHQDEIEVIHLHGYWRNSPTLHTAAQLRSPRRQLSQSLQRLLRQRTLVVMAYGGWDDVITEALADCFNDQQFEGSVRWCFHENNASQLRDDNAHLFHRFEPGIISGRIQFYRGIDCHRILPEIVAELGAAPNVLAVPREAPLPGWEIIDASYLDALDPLSGEEAVRYFDGAVPTWRHATSNLIPHLGYTRLISASLEKGRLNRSGSKLQLIQAAGGEGKSTVLLQVAAAAARSGLWEVLWRPSPELGMSAELVAGLDSSRNWLLVADDAETLVEDLWLCATRLHHVGRHNISILLAVRDTDWGAARGDQRSLEKWLIREDLMLTGLSPDDSLAIVDAWAALGREGLRSLARAESREQRAALLVEAIRASDNGEHDGSFLGGLLATRFDEPGLRAHVATVLERLSKMPVKDGSGSLLDALIYIAICHAIGIPGVHKQVLADLMRVSRNWVSSRVVRPLGLEVGAGETGGRVMTRHRRVAAAIAAESELHFGLDLGEYWERMIMQTAVVGRSELFGEISHGAILHVGPRLQEALPHVIPLKRRKEIAVSAARAAARYQTEWLSCVTDLGRTLRESGRIEEALQVFESNFPIMKRKDDFSKVMRGFLYEWATCWGNSMRGRPAWAVNAWLACCSLSDIPMVPIDRQPSLACAGAGVAFEKLSEGGNGEPYRLARRAAVEIGWRSDPEPRTVQHLTHHERELDREKVQRPGSLEEATQWLEHGSELAFGEVEDGFIRTVYAGQRLTFRQVSGMASPGS